MRNLRIFTKLFLSHGAIGLLAVASLSFFMYIRIGDILIQRTLDQLSSVNILKKELIENYLFSSRQHLEELQLENKFLHLYNELSRTPDVDYSKDLEEIRKIGRLYNFNNVTLFDTEWRQVFSTSEASIPKKFLHKIDSAISGNGKTLHMIDATAFSPEKKTTLYYYVPVIRDSVRVGAVLVEENFQKIQDILMETTGMGGSGESYLVAHDFTMRSSSRFLPEKNPGQIGVQTSAVEKSLRGIAGREIITDYRNTRVLSAYRVVENLDLKWVIISEIDVRDAMEPVTRMRNNIILITLVILLFTLLVTFFLSNAIARPVLRLREVILTLSRGAIPVVNQPAPTTDEIGQMETAIHTLVLGLERTMHFAREIGGGNFKATYSTLSDEDILGFTLLHMRDQLQQLNDQKQESARSRAAALMEGQENERRRIIKELHDGVGQLLTSIRMQVEMLESDNEINREIKKQINDTIDEVRRISYNVMPQAIVDYGLEAALRGLCGTIKKYSPLTIDFRYIREVEHELSFEISIAVFRIAQEGLNNILKHADATNVNVHVLDKEDEIYLVVEDNGKGFHQYNAISGTGSGLRNIRERAHLLSGTAEIHAMPGQGTVIEVHIPILPHTS